ncbi:ester cyclase [Gemmatimonadota bacterium]
MRNLLLVLASVLLLLSGCTSGPSVPEDLGRALIAVWESGAVEDLDEIIAIDSAYEAAQQGYVYEGIDAIKGYVGHVRMFASDLRVEVLSVNSTKTTAVLEWEMTGVQTQPIPGRVVVATNRNFSIKGVTLVEVEGGLIKTATDYMDVLGFVIQLGARVELPGGVVLGGG